jgi:hypothetical protein
LADRCASPTNREDPKLYKFVQHQRAKYRTGSLTEEKVELLELIPWWKWETEKELQ